MLPDGVLRHVDQGFRGDVEAVASHTNAEAKQQKEYQQEQQTECQQEHQLEHVLEEQQEQKEAVETRISQQRPKLQANA